MHIRVALVALLLAALVGCQSGADRSAPTDQAPASTASSPKPAITPRTHIELPGDRGEIVLPKHRLCGFVGYPGANGQGRLGIGDLEERMGELHAACEPYALNREIIPTMELIAVTVNPHPGADGMWRDRVDPAVIDTWLAKAREHGAILLLNIQPGQADFIDEVRALEPYLKQPDVGLALDPEWAMGPGQVPMQSFGSTTGEEMNEVASYLSDLVVQNNLPEKVMVYHILHAEIITNEAALVPQPGVVLIKSVDGIGSPGAKISTYNRVMAGVAPHIHPGFKLFYEEDVDTSGVLMSPPEVLAISPVPDYVMYE